MIWMLPLAGAALGAMANRRRPLQGAMMGGLLGAGAGYAAPALMGAGTAGSYGAGAFGTAAGYGGAGAATTTPVAASGGLLGGLKTAGSYAAPALQAAQAAQTVQGLFGGQQQQAPQMQMTPATGPQSLAQLAQSGDAMSQQNMAEWMKRRMQNQGIINQMMGRPYG